MGRDDLEVFFIPNEVVLSFNNKEAEIKDIRAQAIVRVLKQKQNKKSQVFFEMVIEYVLRK